jgi:hypothetical protein
MAVTTGPRRPRDQGASYRHSAKSFERDGASTPPCRRVRSNAIGPVTQRASLSSGCAASLLRTDVTFDGQNNAGNSRRSDTQVHAADIVGFFGAGRIKTPVQPVMKPASEAFARGLRAMVTRLSASCHAPGIIFPIARTRTGTSFLQWLPRRSLQLADGYVATDVEPRSAAT